MRARLPTAIGTHGSDEMTGNEVSQLGRHPGRHGGRARKQQKGRAVDPAARDEVRALIGPGPHRRDELIELLHAIQDRYGRLAGPHLAALAAEMRLSLAEVYEVATFYHAFDVARDDADAPPALTVRVCDGLPCSLADSELAATLAATYGGTVRVRHGACMGRCEEAPVVSIGRRYVARADADTVARAIAEPGQDGVPGGFVDLAAYRAGGGYDLLAACQDGRSDVEQVLAALDAAGLRGLGGAGFPTGRKWRFVRDEPGPRYLVVNADESEPGTFKDRWYLERDPHRFVEGMLVAAWAVEAAEVFIYLRTEYPHLHALLHQELAAVREAGLCPLPVTVRRGAGAYICGEESAMLESIEGKRGLPRHKPPFPSQVGLFGRPTLINNVETLYWVPDAITRPERLRDDAGRPLRSFSVSGRVREPGVKLVPAGITVAELIEQHCGGMADGHRLAAYLPGGASGGVFPASMADIPLDFGSFEPHGGLIGSAAIIVLSDRDDVPAAVLNLLDFFRDESCGQCTPCRAGTEKAVALMRQGTWDRALLDDLAEVMADASICGLGQAAANPIRCALRYFAEELP